MLAFQDRFTLCVDAAAPVPVQDNVLLEGEPLLVTVIVAFAVPVAVGLNVMVNGAL